MVTATMIAPTYRATEADHPKSFVRYQAAPKLQTSIRDCFQVRRGIVMVLPR